MDVVAGRFTLGPRVGSGGTAEVYRALDGRTGLTVAVKLLRPELSIDTVRWDAFFEEVRAIRAVPHPGVPAIVDWGVEPGEPPRAWIAMEFAVGVTLSSVVRAEGPLDPATALAVADGLLAILDTAHTHSVVHRDVTPANVMFDPDAAPDRVAASVRLLDFGLADIPGRSTAGGDILLSEASTGAVVASVAFASPEHLRGDAVTEASDVYQVAATTLFGLTGAGPTGTAPGASVRDVVDLVGVAELLERALSQSPLRRPADAGAFREALAAAARGIDLGTPRSQMSAPVQVDRTRLLSAAVSIPSSSAARDPGRSAPGAGEPPDQVPSAPPRRRGRAIAWAVTGGAAALVAAIVVAATTSSTAAPTPTNPPVPIVAAADAPSPTPTPTSAPTRTPVADVRLIPDVVGLSLGDAGASLRAAGFERGEIVLTDGADAVDTVLEADPAPGSPADAGTAVRLRVASGQNVVPEVSGLETDEAAAVLRAAGFEAVILGDGPIAAVSDPVAGMVRPHGTRVRLNTRDEPVPTASPTATRAPSPTRTPVSR